MRIAIIGGGIVGSAIAHRILQARVSPHVTVFDKESNGTRHQTGRNSGVVHKGIHYKTHSLKRRLTETGRTMLRAYCEEKGLPYEQVGKLIIARDRAEAHRLRTMFEQVTEAGISGIRLLDPSEFREIEPHAAGELALFSTETAITDYAAVTAELQRDIVEWGGRLRFEQEVTGFRADSSKAEVLTPSGSAGTYDRIVLAAGLQSDRLAALAGLGRYPIIVPFRGKYLELTPEAASLVRGLIYPVADPRYPFLGAHLTRHIDGSVSCGPTAWLALGREYYDRERRPAWGDLLESVGTRAFMRFAASNWRVGVKEARTVLSPTAIARQAMTYIPELSPDDFAPASSGIRAQAMRADGELEEDFIVQQAGAFLAIRNAPSPAATASMAIARSIVEEYLGADRSA